MAQNLLSGAPERCRSSSAVGAYRDQGAVLWHKTGSGSCLRGLDTVFRCAPDLLDRRSLSGHIASFAVLRNMLPVERASHRQGCCQLLRYRDTEGAEETL
jgi:hypothetical protein